MELKGYALSALTKLFTVASLFAAFAIPSYALTAKFLPIATGVTWANKTLKWNYNHQGSPAWASQDTVIALVNMAMSAWSAQCGIRFEYQGLTSKLPTSSDNTNVIGWVPTLDYLGYATWNYSGKHFTESDMRLNQARLINSSITYPIILHEIGHMIGLNHSDIENTVMSGPSLTAYSYASHLTADDLAGCRSLYGLPNTPPADLVVQEFHHIGFDNYFMTADPAEINSLYQGGFDGNWRPTGVTYNVWSSLVENAQPMCRFYGDWTIDESTGRRKGPDSHFFTAIPSECALVPQKWPVWVLEGIAFFTPIPDENGQCPGGTMPVKRFFRPYGDPNHRYVTQENQALEMTAKGWLDEGTAWCSGL